MWLPWWVPPLDLIEIKVELPVYGIHAPNMERSQKKKVRRAVVNFPLTPSLYTQRRAYSSYACSRSAILIDAYHAPANTAR